MRYKEFSNSNFTPWELDQLRKIDPRGTLTKDQLKSQVSEFTLALAQDPSIDLTILDLWDDLLTKLD